jgi:hypothetical protein
MVIGADAICCVVDEVDADTEFGVDHASGRCTILEDDVVGPWNTS